MSEAELREQVARLIWMEDSRSDTGWFHDPGARKDGVYWRIVDSILTLIEGAGYLRVEPAQLEELTETEIRNAITDYRQILEMNGYEPTLADGKRAISFATITKNCTRRQDNE